MTENRTVVGPTHRHTVSNIMTSHVRRPTWWGAVVNALGSCCRSIVRVMHWCRNEISIFGTRTARSPTGWCRGGVLGRCHKPPTHRVGAWGAL